MNNKIQDKKINIEDNSPQDSLAVSIGILADMTRKEVGRSLFYFDINNEEQVLKTNIK